VTAGPRNSLSKIKISSFVMGSNSDYLLNDSTPKVSKPKRMRGRKPITEVVESVDLREQLQRNLAKQLFNVKYDLMEFNDLLSEDHFLESYNKTSRKKGR
jgi:hypothetical protein